MCHNQITCIVLHWWKYESSCNHVTHSRLWKTHAFNEWLETTGAHEVVFDHCRRDSDDSIIWYLFDVIYWAISPNDNPDPNIHTHCPILLHGEPLQVWWIIQKEHLDIHQCHVPQCAQQALYVQSSWQGTCYTIWMEKSLTEKRVESKCYKHSYKRKCRLPSASVLGVEQVSQTASRIVLGPIAYHMTSSFDVVSQHWTRVLVFRS